MEKNKTRKKKKNSWVSSIAVKSSYVDTILFFYIYTTTGRETFIQKSCPNTIHQKQKTTTATSSSSENSEWKEMKPKRMERRIEANHREDKIFREKKYLKCDLSKNTKPTPLSISQICSKKRVRSLFVFSHQASLSLLASLFSKQYVPIP